MNVSANFDQIIDEFYMSNEVDMFNDYDYIINLASETYN